MEKITLTRPDDWHLHVRNSAILKSVLPHTTRQFGRAIIMPNLKPPVTTVAHALQYRNEILAALPKGADFDPLMVLYLTETTSQDEIKKATQNKHIHGFKLYPAGATTHSDSGVTNLLAVYPLFEYMQELDMPLLIHGEVTRDDIDIFDREREFIERDLTAIVRQFPALRIVVEHATTEDAVQFVESAPNNIAATITPQHLMYNRNALLAGGIRPHHYCLPILKREKHRQALVKAATSGNRKFFLGTDSAPHLQHLKESACGCAGCYSAHAALEFYAEIFAEANALDKLEGFASFHGADFYGLPHNTSQVTLKKKAWKIPEHFVIENHRLIPLKAGETIHWKQA